MTITLARCGKFDDDIEEMYPVAVVAGVNENFGELLDQVPLLRDRTAVHELSGGLTNRNLAIDTPSGKYVARVSSNTSSMLTIDRDSEYENSKIAAEAGIGAPVHDYIPRKGLLVIGYLEGHTYNPTDVANNLDRIAQSCRTLHNAKPFVSNFNMFDIQQGYLRSVQENGFRLPDNYLNYLPKVKLMKSALKVLDERTVPCNNDLLPANFIDDGQKIWIIDYEYSGNNDACFELGNIWSEATLEYDCLTELVDAYYQRHRPEKLARAWFLALMSKYGWTLWASIQCSISSFDFDFWTWGMEKFDRARSDFESKRFDEMLELVTQRTN
ncbi:MAG: choline kinase family protein [Ilumatobacteraceae bacterium]